MTYEIGYGKPPENTRFQKGNKYYLKRSKRKPRDVAAIINDTSKLPVEYREGGRTRKATWSELSFRALVRRAANGNLRSMEMVIDEFAHAQRSQVRQDRFREDLDRSGTDAGLRMRLVRAAAHDVGGGLPGDGEHRSSDPGYQLKDIRSHADDKRRPSRLLDAGK